MTLLSKIKVTTLILVSLVLNVIYGNNIQTSETVTDQYVSASIIFPYNGVVDDKEEYYILIKLEHAPHWHTYWINPGDSGYETSINWDLPEGVTVSEIMWPVPEALEFSEMINYGYEDTTYLVTKLNIREAKDFKIRANIDWLMCETVCIPGSASLDIEIKKVGKLETYDKLAEYLNLLSKKSIDLKIYEYLGFYYVENPVKEGTYIYNKNFLVNPSAKQEIIGGYIKLEKSVYADNTEFFEGVLSLENFGFVEYKDEYIRGLYFKSPILKGKPDLDIAVIDGNINIFIIILMGFIGGLILNLMPCVFPVIGLKIMGFVNQAGESKQVIVKHGLVFTSGVLISFWIIAAILLGLRSSGEELGWGFQLQNSMFVWALTVILFVFGLNLSGLFEFGNKVTGVGGNLMYKKGFQGTFYSGILATVVATPCAAPFLAPALGAALIVSTIESFIVFTFIALGLSFPYLIFSCFPKLVGYLPSPGKWMESFKQAMSFLLYLTVAYLIWVLIGQLTDKEQLYTLFGLVFVATACWIYGRWYLDYSCKHKIRALIGVIFFGVLGIWLGFAREESDIVWEPWSVERVEELIEEGRPIYIDFTARWCATCQVNKRVVFGSDKVNKYFINNNVAALIADWTNHDENITRELAKYQRSAVPFNLVYPKGESTPIILPELLTPDIVLNSFKQGN